MTYHNDYVGDRFIYLFVFVVSTSIQLRTFSN